MPNYAQAQDYMKQNKLVRNPSQPAQLPAEIPETAGLRHLDQI
jgi:hypothetical protein